MRSVLVMLGSDMERFKETEVLARGLGYEVVERFTQNKNPRPKFLIGKGKVNEIMAFVGENDCELVIFDNLLSHSQVVALENILRVAVIDKFDLILNVFEQRASSKEAKLQIELARLKRKIPYIKLTLGHRVKKEHPGYGGSGEFIVHSTLTTIERRIRKIECRLERFESRVELQRKRRRGKIVSLAGYTNVGKTTLLNALTGAGKKVGEELFTTLSTKTSALRRGIFINDTIGFLRALPHELIYAFRATLGEIKNSDLILLVLDCSQPREEFKAKLSVCEHTLAQIGASTIPTLHVINKIDLVPSEELEEKIRELKQAVPISAIYGNGIKELKHEILLHI